MGYLRTELWMAGVTAALAVALVGGGSRSGGQSTPRSRPQGSAASSSDAAWLQRSMEQDPADLKDERVRAAEEPDGLAERGRVAELEQALRRLQTRASLLMIVAHPDDEDGGMLTYCSRGLGARVGMLTLTRGEGGQNVMTGDFNDALGLVRTRELLAADRVMGIHQMFGTEVDFGFSKTKEEAFAQWGHERVLYDAVRAVRLFRPLVVTSVFVGAPSDGHGQHQVSGEIAQEVFRAAADPKVFPEMRLPVWAPRAVFGRVPFAQVDGKGMFDYATGKYVPVRFENYVTGVVSTVAPKADVMVPEGDQDAMLGGMSYVQWARRGLALQRTQIGAGVRVPPAGRVDVGYTRYGARTGNAAVPGSREGSGFFEGMDVSLGGVAELAPTEAGYLRQAMAGVDGAVRRAEAAAKGGGPEAAAKGLRDGLVAVRGVIAHVETAKMPEVERFDVLHELRVKEAQFEEALRVALGVSVRAEVVAEQAGSGDHGRGVVPGQTVRVEVSVRQEGKGPVLREVDQTGQFAHSITVDAGHSVRGSLAGATDGSSAPQVLTHSELLVAHVESGARLTRPYYFRKGLEQPFYDVREKALRNAPVTPPALTAWEQVWYGEVPIRMGAVVEVAPAESVAGEIAQPLQIVPAVSVAVEPKVAIVRPGQAKAEGRVSVRSDEQRAVEGMLRLEVPKGLSEDGGAGRFSLKDLGQDEVPFSLALSEPGQTERTVTASAEVGGKAYTEGYTRVGYPGIVRDNLYEPATVRVHPVDVRVAPGLKVAYLPGTGDATVAALANLGVEATTLSVADVEAGALAKYDVLVLGVRAYAAQKTLGAATPKLLAWVKAGGVAVLEYNTAEYGPADAPYPLELGGAAEKVVDETDRVKLLTPESQVLRWPNRISEHDFDGWIEERGHGFMTSWDGQYQAPTEVHDPGQDPQRGGLLVAPYGKGVYVYCAYALYRQWPEGVPGSYRLLANLVSLGRRP